MRDNCTQLDFFLPNLTCDELYDFQADAAVTEDSRNLEHQLMFCSMAMIL